MKILLRAPNVKCPSRKTIQRNSYLILQHPTLLKHKEKGNRKEAIVRETAELASAYVLDQKDAEEISALENTRSLDDIFCVGSRCFSTPTTCLIVSWEHKKNRLVYRKRLNT